MYTQPVLPHILKLKFFSYIILKKLYTHVIKDREIKNTRADIEKLTFTVLWFKIFSTDSQGFP